MHDFLRLAKKLNQFYQLKPKNMKYSLLAFCLLFMLACGDTNNDADNSEMMDPNEVHPIEETLTDSTKLVNDSVIVADTVTDSL